MRKTEWVCTLVVAVWLSLLPGAGWAVEAETEPEAIGQGQIAVFRFHGLVPEVPGQFSLSFEMEPQRSLFEIVERFEQAVEDPQLKAVVLTFDRPRLGWGQMQELRAMLGKLRDADKDVYCYLEEASSGAYQLASAASRICILPTGEIDLAGLHLEQVYFKGLMDKIGVEADVEQVGAYKEAGEPFTRTGPSEQSQEMLQWVAGDLFDQMVETVARGRRMDEDKVRELIDQGPFTASAAVKAGLVDEACYVDEFVESLKTRYGQQVEFVHNYGHDEGQEIDFSNIFALFKTIGQAMSKRKASSQPGIALICVDGLIMTGRTEQSLFGGGGMTGSTTVRQVLTRARKDESIKAVVLRVDSPGGSAIASDIIWHAATLLGTEKPLVVSMGNLAASGGYYVSAGAGTIFADPGTLTGSIGVIGGKLVTKGLWDWLGVNFHETAFGKNADLFNTNRRFDDRQREIVREHLQSVYKSFTDRVVRGRGDRLKKDIEELAGGRVFTGRQAHEHGLVDRLGGLGDAIALAAEQAELVDYEVRPLPEPENFMDLLLRGLTGQDAEGEDIDVGMVQPALTWTLASPAVRELLGVLTRLDPGRAGTVIRSLLRIELLGREQALTVLPGEILVR